MSKKDRTKTAAQERNGNRGRGGRKQTLSSRVEASVDQVVDRIEELAGKGEQKSAHAIPSAEDAQIGNPGDQIETLENGGEPSSLIGAVDALKDGVLYGWALGDSENRGSARVKVIVDGQQVAEGVADCFRQDLLDAGIGMGDMSACELLPDRIFDRHLFLVETVFIA